MPEEITEKPATKRTRKAPATKEPEEERALEEEEISEAYVQRLAAIATRILTGRKGLLGTDTRDELNAYLKGLSEQSLVQWQAATRVRRPYPKTLEALRRNLMIGEATLSAYLDRGEITLDELWTKRGEEKLILLGDEVIALGIVTVDSVCADFSTLTIEEQLEVFERMAKIFRAQVIEKKDELPVTKIAFTTTREVDRLATLLDASHYDRGTTNDDILKSGVNRELLSAIVDRSPVIKFAPAAWETLLPFLVRPVSWVNDRPVPSPEVATLEGDIEGFERTIRA
jgi:hypothetical protein